MRDQLIVGRNGTFSCNASQKKVYRPWKEAPRWMDKTKQKNARMRVESLWRCSHISHVVLMSDFLWKWNFLELPTRFHHLITSCVVVVVWREIVIFIWKTGRERCAASGSLDNEQKLHSKSFDTVPRWSMRGAETRDRFLELKLIFQFFYVARRWRWYIHTYELRH